MRVVTPTFFSVAVATDSALSLLQIHAHQNDATVSGEWKCKDTGIPGLDVDNKESTIACGPDGTWATPYCPTLKGCTPYCPNGCDGCAWWEQPHENPRVGAGIEANGRSMRGGENLRHFTFCSPINGACKGCETATSTACGMDCRNSENKSKAPVNPYVDTGEGGPAKKSGMVSTWTLINNGKVQCPPGCVNDCAYFKYGNLHSCGALSGGWLFYRGGYRKMHPTYCPEGVKNWNSGVLPQQQTIWCGEPPTTTTTTKEDTGEVCKHYETQDTCPSPRCSWDGDACADPPCSSHTSQDDCCGDCEWNADQCQPALFKACPKEGKPGTNVCPEGCTFVDNCEQCEFAAGVWKKDFSKEPWKPSTGSRPQGCFRNRKFNIKCNKFEPGSKYPSGLDKVGTKRGKWPICKLIEPPKKC